MVGFKSLLHELGGDVAAGVVEGLGGTVGVGGVIGTQFVLPELVKKRSKFDLTPAQEKDFEKWLAIYHEKMISRGEYSGQLYDIGFDLPETHAIRKDKAMYYAFYAKHWKGVVELRGLADQEDKDRKYSVVDYENGKSYGTISGSEAHLPVAFNKHLLLEVRPE